MENLENNIPSIPQEHSEDADQILTQEKPLSVEAAFREESREKLEGAHEEVLVPVVNTIEKPKGSKVLEKDSIVLDRLNTVGDIFGAIEKGFPKESSKGTFNFPHPQYWVGPRFLATWVIPLALFKRLRNFFQALYKITPPYKPADFSINKAETIYTSTQKALKGNGAMRFFGARFLAIWVLPLGITAIFIQYLLVTPLIN